MEETTVKNPGSKLIWLRLNSGDYVSIPAGESRSIQEAQLKENEQFKKLSQKRMLKIAEAPAPRPGGAHKRATEAAASAKAEASAEPAVEAAPAKQAETSAEPAVDAAPAKKAEAGAEPAVDAAPAKKAPK